MPTDCDVKADVHGGAASPPLAAVKRLQSLDPELAPIIEALASQPARRDPALYVRGKRAYALRDGLLVTNTAPAATVVPTALVPQVLNMFHDLCLHAGEKVMLLALCKYYFWPSMGRDVKDYVRSCKLCGEFKPCTVKYGKLGTPPLPDLFESIAIDFTHVFTLKSGFTHCLVICDMLSNYCHLSPAKTTSAAEVIKGLENFFKLHGVCRSLHTDAAGFARSAELANFLNKLGIKLVVSASPRTLVLVVWRLRLKG